MKRFAFWKMTLAGLLLIGLLAGCDGANTGVSPSPDVSPAPAEETSVQPENTQPEETQVQPPVALTQDELDEFTQWLWDGHGTLFSAPFVTFDDIDLTLVLHDGTGGGVTGDFTEEDREALASIGVDLDEALGNMLGVKPTGAEINARLEELYGFTLTDEELQERIVEQSKYNGWGEWYYTPVNDTYYHFSNGTPSQMVTCTFGLRRADGSVTLICKNAYGGSEIWQVELRPSETGYQFTLIFKISEENPYEGETLSKEELNEVAQWLNRPGNCELFWSGFSAAEGVDMSALFYDGAGIGINELTQEEENALKALGLGLELDVVKVPAAEALRLLEEKLWLSWDLDQLKERLSPDLGWHYLEEYDAFYHIHGDTMMLKISCAEGVRWDNGMLVVKCYIGEADDTAYTVKLHPYGEGFFPEWTGEYWLCSIERY